MDIISRKKKLLINTGILTASALFGRLITMLFQAWIAKYIGAGGIGLFQLIGSVTALFTVVSISGIRFTATRLISEEAACGHQVRPVVQRSLLYAAIFGIVSGLCLFLYAKPIACLWISDARAFRSLRISAAVMPCVAFSAVFAGYFAASGTVWKSALVSMIEQITGIGLTVFSLRRVDPLDLEQICTSITSSSAVASILALLLIFLFYYAERKKDQANRTGSRITRRLLCTAAPLAVSSYIRSALGTIEHLLIPRMLRISGLSAEAALSVYGMVHGMALTTVLFPSCLLFALAELIVPLITESQLKGSADDTRRMIRKLRANTLLYGSATGMVLMLTADPIADMVFHTTQTASFIRLLAPLIPVMNLDTVTGGCLRGLGRQKRVMQINLLDAALGVALVTLLVPVYGIKGYIMMIFATESVNCLLSTLALQSVQVSNQIFGRQAMLNNIDMQTI